MKLNILWLYSDLMDLYGDKGNIQVLKTRCAKRGIACVVDTCTIGEEKVMKEYDLIFMGGGADHEQSLLYKDLIGRKDAFLEAVESGTTLLLICGGYQLFGQYYKDGDGNRIDGLGLFDYVTESGDKAHRCIGNIAVEMTIDGKTFQAVGFENHGGQTRHVTTPLAKVLKGHGNEYSGAFEGFVCPYAIGTYMHGSLLPKNPQIADIVIHRALKRHYGDVELAPLDDELEKRAREAMLKRMSIAVK